MSQRRCSKPPVVTLLTAAAFCLATSHLPAGAVYFVRGDANGNARVDLSDAVFTLSFLFSGGVEPECRKAADADDSGALELTDAIYTLGHLFLGSPAPPAPGARCGYDPTFDVLGCGRYLLCLQPAREFEVSDGYAVAEGDIIIGRPEDFPPVPVPRSVGHSDVTKRWPGGWIPYDVDPAIPDSTDSDGGRIGRAIAHWHANTPIRFVRRTNESDYVHFKRGDVCLSAVGKVGLKQEIILTDAGICKLPNGKPCTCDDAAVIHEIGHAVGLWHEQTRSDRDEHVKILTENIIEGEAYNFEKAQNGRSFGDYDFLSIMHYGLDSFSMNGKPTIQVLDSLEKDVIARIGNVDRLSPGDIDGVYAMYGGWRKPFRFGNPDNVFPEASGVASVSRTETHVDVFTVGHDGVVYSSWWEEGANSSVWSLWFPIDPDTVFPAQPVTALSRSPDAIDLFVIGFDGRVWTNYWTSGGGWASWFPIDPDTVFPVQKVSAVARLPWQLDLFVIGHDNRVWSNYWNPSSGWASWFQVAPEAAFPVQNLTSISRHGEHIDLFVVGFDNRVWSNYWDSGVNAARWNSWFQVLPDFACPVQSLAAVSRDAHDVSIYAVGFDNRVWSSWWNETVSFAWNGWFQIDPAFACPVQAIGSVARTPGHVDLFAVGFDNRIWSNYWDADAGSSWNTWFQLDNDFTCPPQAISVDSRHGGHVDVFVRGNDGAVWSAWWEGARER